MSQEITYRCDVCKKVKGEANHWFLARARPGVLSFTRWLQPDASVECVTHLCGEQCAQKKLAEFLGSLS